MLGFINFRHILSDTTRWALACKGARRGTPPGPGVQTPCSPQGVRPQGPGGALIYPKRRPLRLSICNSSKYTINETFDTKNSPQKCRNFEIFSWVLSFSLSFELFSLEFFSRWPKIKPVLDILFDNQKKPASVDHGAPGDSNLEFRGLLQSKAC